MLRVDTHISGHFDVPEGVEVIGDEAFEGCESLKFIIIQNPKVYSEHKNGFEGCDAKVVSRCPIKNLVNIIDWF